MIAAFTGSDEDEAIIPLMRDILMLEEEKMPAVDVA